MKVSYSHPAAGEQALGSVPGSADLQNDLGQSLDNGGALASSSYKMDILPSLQGLRAVKCFEPLHTVSVNY